jgi:putative phage-type endonuclease
MTLDMEIRKTGIGSSEVAAVMGLNPWVSAYDVWLEKTGQIEPFAGNEATEWGNVLEPHILARYEKKTGRKLLVNRLLDGSQRTQRHSSRTWQLATPDATVDGEPRLVEAKDVGLRMAKDWGDEYTDNVPEYYLVQVMWQMSTLVLPVADVAALIDRKLRIYEVPFDPELEELLLTRVESFWTKNVMAGNAPEMKATDRTLEYVKRRWNRETAPMRAANEWEISTARKIIDARESAKLYDQIDEQLSLQFKASIGDSEGIAGPGWQATWKKAKDSYKTDWESIALGLRSKVKDEEWQTVLDLHTEKREGSRRLLLKEVI